MGPAARILTEEFYSYRTNFFTFQIERLKTSLSLESTFPKRQNSNGRFFQSQPLRQMFVACHINSGAVLGFAEVDASPLEENRNTGNVGKVGANKINRPYMYNLAVDKRFKRKGIAKALIRECENFVRDMHNWRTEKVDVTMLQNEEETNTPVSVPQLFLRVRKCNSAAIALYEKLGYKEIDPSSISMSKEDVNSGSAEEGELIIFSKDLLVDSESTFDYL